MSCKLKSQWHVLDNDIKRRNVGILMWYCVILMIVNQRKKFHCMILWIFREHASLTLMLCSSWFIIIRENLIDCSVFFLVYNRQSKQVELQFSIASALMWTALGAKAPVGRNTWTQTEDDYQVSQSIFVSEPVKCKFCFFKCRGIFQMQICF